MRPGLAFVYSDRAVRWSIEVAASIKFGLVVSDREDKTESGTKAQPAEGSRRSTNADRMLAGAGVVRCLDNCRIGMAELRAARLFDTMGQLRIHIQ